MFCGAVRQIPAMLNQVRSSMTVYGAMMPVTPKRAHGIPWILLHSESFSNRAEPARKEPYYKSRRGRDELDRLDS